MESLEKPLETYLGDGVYCVFDGWNMILDVRQQGPEKIHLEPPVLKALYEFAKSHGWKYWVEV